jgi:spore coat polysaccharide biosynthesis predicted glycosyltransferase SpsG
MDWADLAVTAAGSTCWELAYLGVPMITIVAAENQRGIADGLATRGAAVNLGWHGEVTLASIAAAIASLADDHRKRASMRRAARELVDGCGADRVVAALAGN